MEFSYQNNITSLIVIDDVFSKDVNSKILAEAVSLKKKFTDSSVGGDNKIDKSMRSNTTAMYDEIYLNRRSDSALLTAVKALFNTSEFRQVTSSAPYPINVFAQTNTDELQVSRYGDSNQKYDWHIDKFENILRIVTFVYYFFKEPKRFKGGDIQFTDCPIIYGKTISKNPETVSISPRNNMAVIFSSSVPHRVLITKSPKNFIDGRFSVNCWIGIK